MQLGCKTGLQVVRIISKQTCGKGTLNLSKKVIFISMLLFYPFCKYNYEGVFSSHR